MVQGAGHDIPGADGSVFLRDRCDRLGKDLKQGFVFDRADGEISLWAVEFEPGRLAACDDEGRNLTRWECSLSSFFMFSTLFLAGIAVDSRLKTKILDELQKTFKKLKKNDENSFDRQATFC